MYVQYVVHSNNYERRKNFYFKEYKFDSNNNFDFIINTN